MSLEQLGQGLESRESFIENAIHKVLNFIITTATSNIRKMFRNIQNLRQIPRDPLLHYDEHNIPETPNSIQRIAHLLQNSRHILSLQPI